MYELVSMFTLAIYSYSTLTMLCSQSQLHIPVYVMLNPPKPGTFTRALEYLEASKMQQ